MFAAALIYILAVISPGPNFILVSRSASSNSILAGVGASIGIVMVGLMFSSSSVMGLTKIIEEFPDFSRVATIAGAIYLLYIAFSLLKNSLRKSGTSRQSDEFMEAGFLKSWKIGVTTNITNMKTIAFMVSIFASFLSVPRTGIEKATVIAICSSFEILWYSLVALIFGQSGMQRLYLRYNRQIDACLAVFLIFFAAENVMAH